MDARAIDALVAEHLFGLDVAERECCIVHERGMNNIRQECIYGIDAMPWGTHGGKQPVRLWVVPGGPGDYQEIPRYSSTWAGLGLVVEAMQARGYQFMLEWAPRRGTRLNLDTGELRPCPLWSASWGTKSPLMHGPDSDYRRGRGEADTAPMAVALAALKALGVEVPQ